MNIFLGIMAVVLFILIFAEKEDRKREHFTWGYISTIIACALVDIISSLTF